MLLLVGYRYAFMCVKRRRAIKFLVRSCPLNLVGTKLGFSFPYLSSGQGNGDVVGFVYHIDYSLPVSASRPYPWSRTTEAILSADNFSIRHDEVAGQSLSKKPWWSGQIFDLRGGLYLVLASCTSSQAMRNSAVSRSCRSKEYTSS